MTGEHITHEGEPEGTEKDRASLSSCDDALEEVVSFAPESVGGGALVSSALTKGAGGRRQGRHDLPIFIPAKIDDVRIDSRYGEALWESGLLYRLIPRPDLLDEEGIRQLCRQLPIHVTRADSRFDAFGGLISHELALRGLRSSREIPVLLHECVSDEEKRVFAVFDQLLMRALMTDDDQISASFLHDLLRARAERVNEFETGRVRV